MIDIRLLPLRKIANYVSGAGRSPLRIVQSPEAMFVAACKEGARLQRIVIAMSGETNCVHAPSEAVELLSMVRRFALNSSKVTKVQIAIKITSLIVDFHTTGSNHPQSPQELHRLSY